MSPAIQAAKEITREQTRQLNIAIEHISAERLKWCPSGCAKTPMAIYLECAATYPWAAKFLRGEEVEWEKLMPRPEEISGLEELKELMEAAQEEFFSALEDLEESRLGEMVDLPWGEKISLGQYIFLPSYHVCYHVGQLNYIQTLLGDGEHHF
jgi:hypothetical protein